MRMRGERSDVALTRTPLSCCSHQGMCIFLHSPHHLLHGVLRQAQRRALHRNGDVHLKKGPRRAVGSKRRTRDAPSKAHSGKPVVHFDGIIFRAQRESNAFIFPLRNLVLQKDVFLRVPSAHHVLPTQGIRITSVVAARRCDLRVGCRKPNKSIIVLRFDGCGALRHILSRNSSMLLSTPR